MPSFASALKGWVLEEHVQDLVEFSKVCVIKFVLSEGEKLVIFYFTNSASGEEGS
jgi:hypothetical protein